MKTIENPNLSIIVSGPCNGKCLFCFWKPEKIMSGYLKRLSEVLDGLPEQFDRISLTGGEPTISSYLKPILKTILGRRARWPKVVLTTNGSNLKLEMMTQFMGIVDHVNISRHDIDDEKNKEIFQTEVVPDAKLLLWKVMNLNIAGIDVTANCVIQNPEQPGSIKRYVEFARKVGFSTVCFRKEHKEGRDLSPTKQELVFSHYKPVSETSCPVCRSKTQIIDGATVIWTASIPEPSEGLDLIYEAVFHPDGTLSADWNKNIILEL